jgi:Protein of unknown function (DUF4038)/Putative collagen-binding domain of a collagenase
MKLSFKLAFLLLWFSGVWAQNPLSHGALKVSDNKRFLVHEDGTPFFWLGDTAWELFHRLNREDAEKYLKNRAEKGFTVIQAVALAEFDGVRVPNPYNELPLDNNDPTKPREAYFKHVDFVIDKAAELGLYIGFLPTWGDKLFKAGWGQGPEIFNAENARVYGKWLGNRYKNRKNLIWLLGGDRNPRDQKDIQVWQAMAAGIVEGVGGQNNAMMSFHPQPTANEDGGSARWFHNDEWLDFNMLQNGHCRETDVWTKIQTNYHRLPTKPTLDGEPIYEDHPVCFNAKELGTSSAYDVRRYAYADLFAGAFGHTYGCHDIWQMYSPNREAVNGPHIYWQEAMDLPGAKQMTYVRRLMESRPMLERVPDQSLLADLSKPLAGINLCATRGNGYAFVYAAKGNAFVLNMGKISGNKVVALWFDPRNGQTKDIGTFDNVGQQLFTPPTTGYGQDWVLILDDATKK